MKKLFLTIAIILLSTASANAVKLEKFPLKQNGIGPVIIGMSLKQASKALGKKVQLDGNYDYAEGKCATGKLADNLGFMYQDDKITRISIWDQFAGSNQPNKPIIFKTPEGATISTSEADLRKLYPAAEISNHAYNPEGHYFKIRNKNGNGYVFETNGSTVDSIGAGTDLDSPESCS